MRLVKHAGTEYYVSLLIGLGLGSGGTSSALRALQLLLRNFLSIALVSYHNEKWLLLLPLRLRRRKFVTTIDFGTTNCSAAYLIRPDLARNPSEVEPIVLKLDNSGNRRIPSCILFDPFFFFWGVFLQWLYSRYVILPAHHQIFFITCTYNTCNKRHSSCNCYSQY